MTPHRLAENESVAFLRSFHVEILRGGMNRLLLRSMPSSDQPSRIEVLFQYVQHLEMPMAFEGLLIEDATSHDGVQSPWADVLVEHPECRVFRLSSDGRLRGRVVAAACSWGEDQAELGAPSMFPMM